MGSFISQSCNITSVFLLSRSSHSLSHSSMNIHPESKSILPPNPCGQTIPADAMSPKDPLNDRSQQEKTQSQLYTDPTCPRNIQITPLLGDADTPPARYIQLLKQRKHPTLTSSLPSVCVIMCVCKCPSHPLPMSAELQSQAMTQLSILSVGEGWNTNTHISVLP